MSPVYDPLDTERKKYMFKEDPDAVVKPVFLNIGATIKVKMSAFNYVSLAQKYKFMVTVENECGDKAYDFYEFYLNDPPRAKLFNIDPVASSITTHTTPVTLSADGGWYDSTTDTKQMLKFKVAVERLDDGNVFLISGVEDGE